MLNDDQAHLEAEVARLRAENARLRAHPAADHQTPDWEKRLAGLLDDHGQDIICVHDLRGEVHHMNPAARRFFGVEGDRYPTLQEILAPESKEEFPWLVERLRQKDRPTGMIKAIYQRKEVRLLEYVHRLVQPAGGADGPLVQVIAHDVTEERRSHHLAYASFETYRDIFDLSSDAILILTEGATILDLNRAALSFYGYERAELIGRSYAALYAGRAEEREEVAFRLRRAWHGETQRFDWTGRTKRGRHHLREVIVRPGRYQNRAAVIVFDRKVQEWRQVEREMAQRNRELEFVHEVIKHASVERDAERFLTKALRKICILCDVPAGAVYETDDDGHRATRVTSFLEDGAAPMADALELSVRTYQPLRRRRRSVLTRDAASPEEGRLIVCPVEAEGELRTLFAFRRNRREVRREELVLLNFICVELGHHLRQKRLQAQLTTYVERYKLLFDSANDGILLLDEGIIVDCNAKAQEIFRYGIDELRGRAFADLSPLEQSDGTFSDVETARRLTKVGRGVSLVFEWRHERSDGEQIDTEVSLNSLESEGGVLMVAIVRDITDRKRAEAALKESEGRFRTLADNAPVLMKMTNANNYFNFFNKQWLGFTGFSTEQALEDGWVEKLHPHDLQKFLRTLDGAFKERAGFEVSYRLEHKDGTYRWMLDRGVPYTDNEGRFRGYISCAVDVTDRRIAEEEA
ncbi:MAG: PAS domain S-box protein, partial [Catalinimonas sp.]